ncbi:AAA family ATPase [Herbaspirillum sp. RV1423]|uniref:AAA family ATPase n=1 Tax=Herbaspirillum sp. RV1423 TaxID=1443993 RepID=UPI0004BC1BD1|nr:AAA family ATPase [Herbaspirillum sp. RV1423]
MKLARIQIDNFLGAHRIDARLTTPVTLFAGPNGAAKSSIGEAVRMAITGETVRVKLKKEYGALVTEGAKAGGALVTVDDDRTYAFNVPGGEVKADDGLPTGGAIAVALNGQQFSTMSSDERRTFLFQLTGVKIKQDDVRERMVKRACDLPKIEATLPLLRTGFPSACDFAKSKATEAKGAWRTITGETYGKVKAEGWAAPAPDAPEGDAPSTDELAVLDIEIANANQLVGQVSAQVRSRTEAAAKRSALAEKAGRVPRATEALEYARKELAEYEPKVVAMRERASGTARVGLLHSLAYALAGLIDLPQDIGTTVYKNAVAVMDEYEEEHGELPQEGTADVDAIASLPEFERGLEVMQNAVKNCEHDLADATAAKGQFDALAAPKKEEALPDLNALQANLTKLKADRTTLQSKITAASGHAAAVAAAKQKTADAAKHHADVSAWTVVADALAPDGIPGDLLKEALKPVNDGLLEEAGATDWRPVSISPEMDITAAGRPYALLSESEKWRADAMIAVTVARLSGIKILMLDRVDVLDLPSRSKLLGWVHALVISGEIETALLFATLKALPSKLPASMAAHWVQDGEIVELKEAA